MRYSAFAVAVTALTLAATGFAADKDAKPNPSPEAINTSPGAETAVSSAQAGKHGKDTNHPGQRAPITGVEFATKAAMGGMTEVALSKVAEQKATSPALKTFAAMMVTDHTSANARLRAIAELKKITLPPKLDAKHQAMVDKLSSLSGAAFDKAYTAEMVTDHQKTVALFKSAKENVTDAELKSFATTTLPIIQGHLEKITAIQAGMK